MRVLVASADELASDEPTLASELRRLGCDVSESSIWQLHQCDVDCVAIVLAMGDQGALVAAGLECAKAAKSLRGIPIVVALSVTGLAALDITLPFADMVLTPVVPVELFKRLQRVDAAHAAYVTDDRASFGSLTIDFAGRTVDVSGAAVALTHQEFELLAYLVKHPGRVFSRDQLLRDVWSVEHYGGSRTVDIHVRRLRAKLGHAADRLETVRGVGYKFRRERPETS